jgi:hypothetical protein
MIGWSFNLGLRNLQNSLFEWNPSRQLVGKHSSLQGEVENSLKANTFIDSSKWQGLEHCIQLEMCDGEALGKALSSTDVRC